MIQTWAGLESGVGFSRTLSVVYIPAGSPLPIPDAPLTCCCRHLFVTCSSSMNTVMAWVSPHKRTCAGGGQSKNMFICLFNLDPAFPPEAAQGQEQVLFQGYQRHRLFHLVPLSSHLRFSLTAHNLNRRCYQVWQNKHLIFFLFFKKMYPIQLLRN